MLFQTVGAVTLRYNIKFFKSYKHQWKYFCDYFESVHCFQIEASIEEILWKHIFRLTWAWTIEIYWGSTCLWVTSLLCAPVETSYSLWICSLINSTKQPICLAFQPCIHIIILYSSKQIIIKYLCARSSSRHWRETELWTKQCPSLNKHIKM